MPTEQDKPAILARVAELLAEARSRGVHLKVSGSRLDDEWLYLIVVPTQGGERASQHARLMTEIERKLQAEGYDQVLIVPAVPEHSGLNDVPDEAATPPAA